MRRGLVIQKQRWGRYWLDLYKIIVRNDVANVWQVKIQKEVPTYNQKLTGFRNRAKKQVLTTVKKVFDASCVVMRHCMRTSCVFFLC